MSKILTVKEKNKTKQRERKIEEGTTSSSRDQTLVEENEPEVVDVSRMTFVESAEIRMDELHQFRERSSSLESLDSMLDGMEERSLMDKTMKQFHEFELKNTLTLATKAIGMVDVLPVFEKDSPLKIEKSNDIAQFSDSVQAAFDQRSVTLKEKQNQNAGFYSDLSQKIREESERNEKEIEELEELMSREVNSSIIRFDPPEDDQEDSFQISEKDMEVSKQQRVAHSQKTKDIRSQQNANKELKMSSVEQAKLRTTQNEKISSLKSEKAKQMKNDAEGKINATLLEKEKLQMEIEEEKKLLAREREEMKEVDKEDKLLASHLQKQDEEDHELEKVLQTSSSKLEELYAEDSRAKEDQAAVNEKEKELEAHKISLNQEFIKTDCFISANWTKSVTTRRQIHVFNVEISESIHELDAKREVQGKAEEQFNSKLKEVEDLEENAKREADAAANEEEELHGLDEQVSSLTKEMVMDDEQAECLAKEVEQATAADEDTLKKMSKLVIFQKIESS